LRHSARLAEQDREAHRCKQSRSSRLNSHAPSNGSVDQRPRAKASAELSVR
jgi:hypothetical protein